jgi:hydroxyacylglutathione hydrolase
MKSHGPLQIETFTDPSFAVNTFLLTIDGQPEAWIIDPGLPPIAEQLAAAITERDLTPTGILLTHCHADHLAGVTPLCERFPDLKLLAPRDEAHMLQDPEANLSAALGFEIVTPDAHQLIAPGDAIALGTHTLNVLDVAGHSPGGLAFYLPDLGIVFAGDALFARGIGRYDFPGSSGTRLIGNIRAHLLSLPDETIVYAGHGPATTIADERAHNPYLRGGLI